jgi:hypothetical protein
MHTGLWISQEHRIKHSLRNCISVATEKEVLPCWLDCAEECYEVGRDAVEEAALKLFMLPSLEVPANAIPERVADHCSRRWRLKVLFPPSPGILGPSLEVQVPDDIRFNFISGNRRWKRRCKSAFADRFRGQLSIFNSVYTNKMEIATVGLFASRRRWHQGLCCSCLSDLQFCCRAAGSSIPQSILWLYIHLGQQKANLSTT